MTSARKGRRVGLCGRQPGSIRSSTVAPPQPTSMGNTNSVPAMSNLPLPKIKFRVLVIGRANAGKTSILQRVCDTTDSPVVHRGDEEVRGLTFVTLSAYPHSPQVRLDPSMDVSVARTALRLFLISELAWRAPHRG